MNPSPSAIWLVPVDGSEIALNAVRHAIKEAKQASTIPEIDLLNVQAPLSNDISRFISADTLREYHQESGAEALAKARELLAQSGLPHRTHILIGDSASVITEFARQHRSTMIIMGARGLGSLFGTLLGSVSMKVANLSPVPVLLVK